MFNQEVILTPHQCESIINMNNGFESSKVIRNSTDVYVSNIRTSTESKVYTSREVKSILFPHIF